MIIQGLTLDGGFKLDPPDPSKFVVGAWGYDSNKGAVYVYNTDGTGEQKITASDGAASDRFGHSVAISDTKVVVGSAYDDDSGSNSGSVYVYNLDGTGEQKITASDAAGNDRFGEEVAMSDTKIVVGAVNNDDAGSNSGSVYVYNTDGTGEVKITASDHAVGDQFGFSVAIADTKVVVGSFGDDDSGFTSGSVYVYNTDGTGEVKITASDGAAYDGFGYSVAISSTKIVVAAINDDDSGNNSGSIYVYNLDGTGQVKIKASDGAQNDAFGYSVAISDTKIVVGATGDNSYAGAVYVYNLDGSGEVKIQASDHTGSDYFGTSVAITDTKIMVGALNHDFNKGAAYIYNLDGTGEQKIQSSDAATMDQFGNSIAA